MTGGLFFVVPSHERSGKWFVFFGQPSQRVAAKGFWPWVERSASLLEMEAYDGMDLRAGRLR
jgi:hypothetical protein